MTKHSTIASPHKSSTDYVCIRPCVVGPLTASGHPLRHLSHQNSATAALPQSRAAAGGKLVIINLQDTPKNKKADLVIHARCDVIMKQLMTRLHMPIPAYVRQDSVVVVQTTKPAKSGSSSSFSCVLSVQSIHGPLCPLPLVKEVEISFEVSLNLLK